MVIPILYLSKSKLTPHPGFVYLESPSQWDLGPFYSGRWHGIENFHKPGDWQVKENRWLNWFWVHKCLHVPIHSLWSIEKQIPGKEHSLCCVRQVCCSVCVHFKTEVIFFHSFLSCRSPVPTATSFLPTQRLQLGRAGPGLSQLPLWCLPAKHSSGVSPGCEVRKRLHGLVFFIHSGRCLARSLGMHTPPAGTAPSRLTCCWSCKT